ncbi:MAG: hypothetical protein CVT64_09740 [Actinobacteria bacterium HGW-Actinobacteria-4]|nr:MAG: hypothetical protein CVT64_09740 [Actinobacteria bacterium HGW-Actinobacteria-4]
MSSAALARAHTPVPAPVPAAQKPRVLPAPASPYSRKRRTLGDPTPLACTVAKTALEVVLGGAGVETLTRWVAPELRESLAFQHSLARRAGVRAEPSVRIARVRVFRVSATAAEVSVVAQQGEHARAIAMRLEDVAGRWLTTVLEVG